LKLKLFKPKNKEAQPVKPHGSLNAAFLPERVREREDHIRVNDTYRRMLVVESLPEMITFAWFNRISAIPGVAISVYISPYSYEEASKRVGDYQTSIGAELIMCEKQMNTRRMGALNEKYDFFSALLTAVNLHRANIAAVTVTIMVTGNNYEEMHMRYRKVVDVLGNTKAVTLYRRQLEGLKAVLPTAQMVLPEYHDVTVANAACLSPLINLDFSHPSGIFFGVNETGSPVFLDTFIGQPRLFGLHMFLTGMTRSGKSYTCKGLIARSLVHGIRTVVVDPEGEYTALAEALGGTCVRFHPNMECMFNVFDIEPEFNKEQGGYYIDIAAKQDDIVSLIAAMLELQTKEKLSAEERAIAGKPFGTNTSQEGLMKILKAYMKQVGLKQKKAFLSESTTKKCRLSALTLKDFGKWSRINLRISGFHFKKTARRVISMVSQLISFTTARLLFLIYPALYLISPRPTRCMLLSRGSGKSSLSVTGRPGKGFYATKPGCL
jgi:hypothetical protein